jgi:hypothetical protein
MSEPKIYKQMVAIMSGLGAIGKGSKNAQQNYSFRGIDDIINEANPVFKEHGVFVLPEVLETIRETHTNAKGTLLFYTLHRIRYTFMADDGSSVTATVSGEGMDSGDKSSNKAMSAAFKYALTQSYLIPTSEPKDSENDHYEGIKPNSAPPKPKPAPAKQDESSVYEDANLLNLQQGLANLGITTGPDVIAFYREATGNTTIQRGKDMTQAEREKVLAAINKRVDEGVK